MFLTVNELIPVLQTAIGPVILISGVGMLLLTMTNRLGRVIDQTRAELGRRASGTVSHEHLKPQLSILWNRAKNLRLAIACLALSALCAALLIVLIFLTAVLQLESAVWIAVFFAGALLLLVFSLLIFVLDVNRSLLVLRLEIGSSLS